MQAAAISDVLAGRSIWGVDVGDAAESLRAMPDGCVQCVVTSPPYWGLRDYGTAVWDGGSSSCDHRPSRLKAGRGESRQKFGDSYATHGTQLKAAGGRTSCDRCGAVKVDHQIGLESTPAEYVARMVTVFTEVRRVLAADGTCFVNIGDSYANDNKGQGSKPGPKLEGRADLDGVQRGWRGAGGLKKKDRVGIPHLLTFALRDSGWWWRDEIVWHKPNPMVKSVRDRTTDAHEFLFLFTKSPRYFWDFSSMQEPAAYAGKSRGGSKRRYEQNAAGCDKKVYDTRNRRSVWKVTPDRRRQPGGKHFAVMPVGLVEPCVLAGSRPGDLVLDPFAGSGTTLAVAVQHNRRAVGVELSTQYAGMIRDRMADVHPQHGSDS